MGTGDKPKSKNAGGKAGQPFRSKAGGVALFVIAAFLAAYAIHVAVAAYNQDFLPGAYSNAPRDDFEWIVLILVITGALVQVGRKLLAPSAEQVLAHDHRAPVVYLRPFDEDCRRVHSHPVGTRIGGRTLEEGFSSHASAEKAIAQALSRIGPFIAVGMPGDMLSPLGAARLYLSDDNWQAEVEALVRRAAAIVLVPETSLGTRWEIAKVVRWADPRRVLMIVPDPALRPLGYARIRKLSAQSLPAALPEGVAGQNVFMFDAHHRPSPLPPGKITAMSLEPFVAQVLGRDGISP
jgi:hypothetical protein